MSVPRYAKASIAAVLVVAAAGTGWALTHHESAAASQSTDDAYVRADFSTMAPRVRGQVAQLLVEDNQRVQKGQLLAVIDDRDYKIEVASAEAALRSAQAGADGLRAAIRRQADVIGQASATIETDRATLQLSKANALRYQDLASDGSASMQERQETEAKWASDQAVLRRDTAAHKATQSQIPIMQANLANAEAEVLKARAALDAARLNLSYTRIVAPVAGVVGRRSVRVGNYVEVGTPLMAIVPLNDIYVEASFRETQMRRIRPGQAARITVDALPGVELKGHVESIAPASGVTFASVAPENGTGNFTKITQRLPVRIVIDPNQQSASALRVGMSAVPTIDTPDR